MVGRSLLISQNFGHYRFWAKIRYELRYHNWGFVTLITRFILSQNDYYLNEMFASVTLQLLEESPRTTGAIILNWREHFGSDTVKLLKLLTLLSTPMPT